VDQRLRARLIMPSYDIETYSFKVYAVLVKQTSSRPEVEIFLGAESNFRCDDGDVDSLEPGGVLSAPKTLS
jgi:hypothetical protein